MAATDIWEGPGQLFDLNGQPAGAYNLVVEVTKNGVQTETHVKVALSDGTQIQRTCTSTSLGVGWSSKCDYGTGGGYCFGEGLCLSYEEDASGRAFATTIVMDGPNDMRLVRTELQNGQAVRFFREKLHKK